jgi:protein-L-isoaspartate(D-aspartate) O-methyltransferase
VREVYTVEIIAPLAREAAVRLAALGYVKVAVRAGDGYAGWPEAAPFDAIIVTCAPDRIPPPLREQLKPGGRLCIPVGPAGGEQELRLLEKTADGSLVVRAVLPVRFVPMTGRVAAPR